jgi:hypothetical protein
MYGGPRVEEARNMAGLLEDARVDMIEVSAGFHGAV